MDYSTDEDNKLLSLAYEREFHEEFEKLKHTKIGGKINSLKKCSNYDVPDNLCLCCRCWHFKRSLAKLDSEEIKKYESRFKTKDDKEKLLICQKCLDQDKIIQFPPLFSKFEDLEIKKVDSDLSDLNRFETRLVSPKLFFWKIKLVDSSLNSQILYVPIQDVSNSSMLPRAQYCHEVTFTLVFKKKDPHLVKSFETFRPNKVNDAIKFLLKTKLFNDLKITNNKNWNQEESNMNKTDIFKFNLLEQKFRLVGLAVNYKDLILESVKKFNNRKDYTNNFRQEQAYFLKIFGGEIISPKVDIGRISLIARCKSFLQREDRRCSKDEEFIFHMFKEVIIDQLVSFVNTRIKSTPFDQMESNLGKIQTTPWYWLMKKKMLNSMMRQIGRATFIIELNSALLDWPELMETLLKVNRLKLEKNVSIDEKRKLIIDDPVTTARYVQNRMRHLLNFILDDISGPFSDNPIEDFYWRIDSSLLKVYLLIWLKDPPLTCTIENYISCSKQEMVLGQLVCKYQKHRHDKLICGWDDSQICKHGFPKPMLHQTMILEPLDVGSQNDISRMKREYSQIRAALKCLVRLKEENEKFYITFENFLKDINLTTVSYINALRSSIKKPTLFLKRQSDEIMNMEYNSSILMKNKANMNITYIMNDTDCMEKMGNICKNTEECFSSSLEFLIRANQTNNIFGQKLEDYSEVSKYDCIFKILEILVVTCSRESVLINNQSLEWMKYYYRFRPIELANMCLAEFYTEYNVMDISEKYDPLEKSVDDDLMENINIKYLQESTENGNMDLLNEIGITIGFIKRYKKTQILEYESIDDKVALFSPFTNEPGENLDKNYENEIKINESKFNHKSVLPPISQLYWSANKSEYDSGTRTESRLSENRRKIENSNFKKLFFL